MFTFILYSVNHDWFKLKLKEVNIILLMIIRLIPTYIYFFYGAAECANISLKCRKVKLLVLNNFDYYLW